MKFQSKDCKPEFFSTKTISDDREHIQTEVNDNPEWDLFSNVPPEETVHILRLERAF
jgi:hypothetical protein